VEVIAMVNRFPGTVGSDVVSLREAMDRLLSDSFVGSPFRWASAGNGGARAPLPLDVYATADEVVVLASVPGLGPNDIQVTVNQGTVTLSGQLPNVGASEEAKGATWYLHELPYGAFQRSLALPIEVDPSRADATFEHGILRLRLPKAEQARPRQIKVRVTDGTQGAITGEATAATNGASEGTSAEARQPEPVGAGS
jgi:HSP20 family protein